MISLALDDAELFSACRTGPALLIAAGTAHQASAFLLWFFSGDQGVDCQRRATFSPPRCNNELLVTIRRAIPQWRSSSSRDSSVFPPPAAARSLPPDQGIVESAVRDPHCCWSSRRFSRRGDAGPQGLAVARRSTRSRSWRCRPRIGRVLSAIIGFASVGVEAAITVHKASFRSSPVKDSRPVLSGCSPSRPVRGVRWLYYARGRSTRR